MSVTRTWRLIAAFILAVPLHGLTQEAPAGKPAPSNVRGGEYPRILPDRRVIFRTRLPEAKTVAVRARGNDSGMGAETYALKAMGEGLWEVTIGPIRSGFRGGWGGGYANGKKLHSTLESDGVKHVWFETLGSHEWQVWRKSLYDFAPRLFRTGGAKKTQ